MSVKNKILPCLIALAIVSPVCVIAGDLTIINNTNHDSTSVVNNGACSTILGPSGITIAHSSNVVPEAVITKACIFNKTNCKAEVHMTNNCSGPIIATVTLDVKSGIKSIQPSTNTQGYMVSGSGFTASLNGGPAYKNWFQKLFNL